METMTEAIDLTLPDGSVRTVPAGTTPLAVAAAIGPRLAKDAVGAELDGKTVDLRLPLQRGGAFRVFTVKSPESGAFVRHSAEHVLADAVKRLWPEAEYDAGRQDHSEKFQYDFRFPRAFTPEDLERIEAKMREILAEKSEFERVEVSREEAERTFRELGETLKVERLKDIPEGETITLFKDGGFVDLCRGPHVRDLSQVGAVKLLEASSVYFKGDERNERLQRIYGTAFATQKEMDEHMAAVEAAKARDHRRLGTELDLFSFNPLAPAMPFFHPNGAAIYIALMDYVREVNARYGYGEVITPQILDVELWKTSGHYDNYRENMFFTEADERQMSVKPMNCPTHCLIFGTRLRSYRDLPVRYSDFGRLHRYERSGVTNGLFRVRSFAQDDAHVFCMEEQVEEVVLAAAGMILEIYRTFGFDDVRIELSTRPEKRIGSDELWDRAEGALASALEEPGDALPGQPRRRRLLRAEDRLPRPRLDRPQLAARHGAARLPAPAAVRPQVRGGGRRRAPAGDDPPGHARIDRAVHGDPDRADGGGVPPVAGAGAGGGAAHLGEVRRLRRGGPPGARRGRVCGSSSTRATRSWATASARRSSRRSPTCWWWGRARRRTGRSRRAGAPARTWAPSPRPIFSRGCATSRRHAAASCKHTYRRTNLNTNRRAQARRSQGVS